MLNPPGILLFTMEGLFSRICLEAIIDNYSNIRGIVLPSHSSITRKPYIKNNIDVFNPASVESLAVHNKIPVFYIASSALHDFKNILARTKPDMILMAGFPYRLPPSLFNFPKSGAYNVHPSLLPAYRGPVPLFWQFYYGELYSGVTIHRIEEEFDTGDIALQERIPLHDGISSKDATIVLGRLAAKLIQRLIEGISADTLHLHKQDESKSSYYGWPDLNAFKIPASWSARRAYNFICGTRHWNHTYRIIMDDCEVTVRDARGYSDSPGKKDVLRFNDGYLEVTV